MGKGRGQGEGEGEGQEGGAGGRGRREGQEGGAGRGWRQLLADGCQEAMGIDWQSVSGEWKDMAGASQMQVEHRRN